MPGVLQVQSLPRLPGQAIHTSPAGRIGVESVMAPNVSIVTVDETNLDRLGFFCYKSKRKSGGYLRKHAWVRDRLDEGLRLHILYEDDVSKGFVEAIPGRYAWRAVNAPDYLFVHCLWVVGKAKGKGYGSRLLDKCIREASDGGFKGVAVLAREGTWLTKPPFFLNAGFEIAAEAEPGFSLLAHSFDRKHTLALPADWTARREVLGQGLTVVYTDQCPYIDRMKQAVFTVGRDLGIPVREVQHTNCRQVQDQSPSPYGVYNIVLNGELVATHPIGTKSLRDRMAGLDV
jgi:N-acetylglutamate synthase-like GNAT family acetyltransferase